MRFPINTLIALAFLAGIVFLQIFLSERKKKLKCLLLLRRRHQRLLCLKKFGIY